MLFFSKLIGYLIFYKHTERDIQYQVMFHVDNPRDQRRNLNNNKNSNKARGEKKLIGNVGYLTAVEKCFVFPFFLKREKKSPLYKKCNNVTNNALKLATYLSCEVMLTFQ